MKVTASTEMSRLMLLQRQTAATRGALDRAGQEMTTGLKADKYKATGGDLARLFAVERMLERNMVHANAVDLTTQRLDQMQIGLLRMEVMSRTLAVDLITTAGVGDVIAARVQSDAALSAFEEAVTLLNAEVGGQSLYSGTATNRPAFAPAAAILANLEARVGGLPVALALDEIDTYFAWPNGDFIAENYTGAREDVLSAELGDGTRVAYGIRGDAPEVLQLLKGLAAAALAARGGTFETVPSPDLMALLDFAGRTLLGAKEGILDLSARTGAAQEIVEAARVQRQTERESLEMTRARILGADPFDTASLFQAMEAQLQSVYTVTARLANLRFANFIR